MTAPIDKTSSRREFLKTSAMIGGALAAPAILSGNAFALDNSETLKIGLIGCGGRGTGATGQALHADENVALVAMADAFEDRLQTSLKNLQADKQIADKIKVAPDHCFTGFDAYQKLLNSGVDVVLLATPPGFRPLHLEAAIAAGKHVFTEKPMAVDAPGVRSVLATAAEAKKKNLSLVSGFCYRYSRGERELFKRVLDGAIGDLQVIYGTYNTSSLWVHPRQPGWTDMQAQMRNWYYFAWLSGDHIVEQAVHNVNKIAWAMGDAPPLKATGLGGRQVRTGSDFGHIYDHFTVVYEYPNGTRANLFCRQMDNCSNDVSDHGYGTKGTYRIIPFQSLEIKGAEKWKHGRPEGDMYQIEHNEFFASIRSGKLINDGEMMARSTMMAIMGRMAAYTGQTVTWDEAFNSQETLMPPKVDWDVSLTTPPVAMPGVTKLV